MEGRRRIEAHSVVLERHPDSAMVRLHRDHDASRVPMLHHVDQRIPHDAIEHGARLDGGFLAHPVIQMGCDPHRLHHVPEEPSDRVP